LHGLALAVLVSILEMSERLRQRKREKGLLSNGNGKL
jgi:hypothetical protein